MPTPLVSGLIVLTCSKGAVRLSHKIYAIRQACANAAKLTFEDEPTVQGVPHSALLARLKKKGVILDADSIGVP